MLDEKRELSPGMFPAILFDQSRNHFNSERVQEAKCYGSGFVPGLFVEQPLAALKRVECPGGMFEKQSPIRRQRDSAPLTIEKRDSQLFLQLSNSATDRGLRHE